MAEAEWICARDRMLRPTRPLPIYPPFPTTSPTSTPPRQPARPILNSIFVFGPLFLYLLNHFMYFSAKFRHSANSVIQPIRVRPLPLFYYRFFSITVDLNWFELNIRRRKITFIKICLVLVLSTSVKPFFPFKFFIEVGQRIELNEILLRWLSSLCKMKREG